MRAVLQRVTNASVTVDCETVGEIGKGFLILLGVTHGDTQAEAELLARKISGLRVFSDEQDKMNLSLLDIEGEALVVSQFTLYADCKKGRRPSFTDAAKPEEADQLYQTFVNLLLQHGIRKVETGRFGADMKVSLLNDGPVTIVLDTDQLK
ncbi:D-aminoacyl-tRNA deacylase [Solibaculum mannosilyticum]|uniref:D-aminoacyl-tRNA deacylase n=1 Tax=Solibaculum mannosilyticum TaxID=2780922 RepID=A0A7I8D0D4_9FIRM|nr:D-aminoacyl-tRNA deacylase [Solibaculum mannosilyticum]BCI60186.1 D-aminoacyl-tRNA deacylase [Solibaculum mannosilyticum]